MNPLANIVVCSDCAEVAVVGGIPWATTEPLSGCPVCHNSLPMLPNGNRYGLRVDPDGYRRCVRALLPLGLCTSMDGLLRRLRAL